MTNFWDSPTDANRFPNVRCSSCKQTCRLGKWLRRAQERANTIEAWLQHNNAITTNEGQPAHMTVELYATQSLPEERSLKRSAPNDATTSSSKRTKHKSVHKIPCLQRECCKGVANCFPPSGGLLSENNSPSPFGGGGVLPLPLWGGKTGALLNEKSPWGRVMRGWLDLGQVRPSRMSASGYPPC